MLGDRAMTTPGTQYIGRDIMTGIANGALHHPRSVALSEEQIFRLWCAAIKDDDKQVDEVIRRVYRDMIAYDRNRAEDVIYLTITRSVSARRALADLLGNIPMPSSSDPLPALH
jgi:hypothetical protein